MLERAIGGKPVLDSGGKLRGIVTESDFAVKERGIPFSLVRAPHLFGEWLGPIGVEDVYMAARTRIALLSAMVFQSASWPATICCA